jgi:hypothetical protein
MNQCIFCKSRTNEFTQTEHLIPESLGGDQVLPPGFVCDPCNGYFGREVERRALDTPILSFLRTSLCIPNKKGDQRHYEGFRFEVFGQDSGESFVVFPPKKLQYVLEHGEGQMLIPITGLGAIARLMLKMGLECIALDQQCDIFDPIFDDARVAARAPKPNMTWPLAYGRLRLEDTVVEVQEDDEGLTIEELVLRLHASF